MRQIDEILERVQKVREIGCPVNHNHFLRCDLSNDESYCRVWCEDCGWETMVTSRQDVSAPDHFIVQGRTIPIPVAKIKGYAIFRGNGDIVTADKERLPFEAYKRPSKCALIFFDRNDAERNAYDDMHVAEVHISYYREVA